MDNPDRPEPKRTWPVREIPNPKFQIPNEEASFGQILNACGEEKKSCPSLKFTYKGFPGGGRGESCVHPEFSDRLLEKDTTRQVSEMGVINSPDTILPFFKNSSDYFKQVVKIVRTMLTKLLK